ncbi:MAG: redoxin domain-containing protein [Acidobacteriota bacterium]
MNTSAHCQPAQVGRHAPPFEVEATQGPGHVKRTICLEDYGDRWLILMFYPLDFSLICPTELLALSHRYQEFVERAVDILGISTDSIETHDRWIATPFREEGLEESDSPWRAIPTVRWRGSTACTQNPAR